MTPIDPKSDAWLVSSILSGKREDFAILVDRYYSAIRAYVRSRSRDDGSAEDAAQESFLVAIQRLPQLRKPERFGPWLFAIARNQCNAAARGGKREVSLEGIREPAIEVDLESREVRAIVRREIEKLPDSARDVLTLHYFGGLELPDAARLLGISHAAARKRLQRAREALGGRLLRTLSDTPAEKAQLVQQKRAVTAIAAGAALNWNTANAAGAFAITGGILVMKKVVIVAVLAAAAGLVMYTAIDDSATEPSPDSSELEATQSDETVQSEAVAVLTDEVLSDSTEPEDEVTEASPFIHGKVLDDKGNPVPAAEVRLWRWTVPPMTAGRNNVEKEIVETDSEGTFQFALVDASPRLSLFAKKEGMVQPRDTQVNLTPYDGSPVEAVLRLYPTASIRGRVIDQRRRPVVDKEVTTYLLDSEALETESATTDSRGYFDITSLNPGEHNVAVIPQEQVSRDISDAKVTVGPGEVVDDIEIVYAGDDLVYAGRVVDEMGNALSRVFVQLIGVYGPNPADTYTGEDGTFRIVRLPEGRYSLMVNKRGYANVMDSAVTGTEDAEIVLQTTDERLVKFRVIDAKSREPLPNAGLATVPGQTARFETMQYGVFMNQILSDGRFEKEYPGSWEHLTAIFRAEGYLFGYAYVDFMGNAPDEVLVEMHRGPVARGVVVMPDGTPVPDAYILTGPYPRNVLDRLPADGEMRQSWFVSASAGRTDADGTFVIDTLDESMEFLTAMHTSRGYATIPVDFSTIGQKELRIVLSPGAVLEGIVTVGGVPTEGVGVRYSQEDVERTVNTNSLEQTGSDGTYRFEQMTPGRYRIMARIPQAGAGVPFAGRIAQSLINIAPDETVSVDFVFDAPVADVAGVVTVDGEPAGSGEVHLTVDAASGVNQFSMRLEPGGAFVIKGVPAGLARIIATAGDAPIGLTHSSASSVPMEFSIVNGPIVELELDVNGGRKVVLDVSGLYADENFLSFDVVEGDFPEGESFAPFGDWIRIARVSGEPGQRMEIPGLHPGKYTVVATAMIMTPQRAARGVRSQRITFIVSDDGSLEPLSLGIPF